MDAKPLYIYIYNQFNSIQVFVSNRHHWGLFTPTSSLGGDLWRHLERMRWRTTVANSAGAAGAGASAGPRDIGHFFEQPPAELEVYL